MIVRQFISDDVGVLSPRVLDPMRFDGYFQFLWKTRNVVILVLINYNHRIPERLDRSRRRDVNFFNSMGQCITSSLKDDDDKKRHLNASSSLTSADSANVNRLLNLLQNNEVDMLTQIFTYHCRNYDSSCAKSYSVMIHELPSLAALFPLLQNVDLFPDKIRHNVFEAFDNTRKNYIDLRDLCRVFAIATRGSRIEMEELVFLIFADSNELKANEIRIERGPDTSTVSRRAINVRQTHPAEVAELGDFEKVCPVRQGKCVFVVKVHSRTRLIQCTM
jgi:hypothetical protein